MHPRELARHQLHGQDAIPVRVQGYRRSFCQEPSWRKARDLQRGVLAVHPRAGAWFNAVLVPGLSASNLPGLDERERGYHRVQVHVSQLQAYSKAGLPECVAVHLYIGRGEKYNELLLPNERYMKICLEGARRWGDDFLNDFRASTFIQARTPL